MDFLSLSFLETLWLNSQYHMFMLGRYRDYFQCTVYYELCRHRHESARTGHCNNYTHLAFGKWVLPLGPWYFKVRWNQAHVIHPVGAAASSSPRPGTKGRATTKFFKCFYATLTTLYLTDLVKKKRYDFTNKIGTLINRIETRTSYKPSFVIILYCLCLLPLSL